jgi:nicotinamidase-related amidase
MPHQSERFVSIPILERSTSLLVVVDVQERMMKAMPELVARATIDNVLRLVRGARVLDVPVVVTEQYPKGLGHTLPEVAEAVDSEEPPIEKVEFSCELNRGYRDCLERFNRRQVVLCGVEAHVCVLQTALDALHRQREVFVAADATCSRRSENHAYSMEHLRQAGAVPTPTESVLFSWMRRAEGPEFKEISRLVK